MHIRPADPDDAVDIAYIYNYYIATSHCTFEIEPIDELEMQKRMREATTAGYPFLVAEDGDEIVGYAYAHEYKSREAYRHSVEVSVYVRPGHDGRRVGTTLYDALFSELAAGDFRAVIAGISLPNDASVHLHEKFGFNKVAHFREVGRKFDRWIDVGYWELMFDNPPQT
jgi:L-amino acid N-acyltransferase YncA